MGVKLVLMPSAPPQGCPPGDPPSRGPRLSGAPPSRDPAFLGKLRTSGKGAPLCLKELHSFCVAFWKPVLRRQLRQDDPFPCLLGPGGLALLLGGGPSSGPLSPQAVSGTHSPRGCATSHPFPGHRPQGCPGEGAPHGFGARVPAGAPAEGPAAGGLPASTPPQPDPASFPASARICAHAAQAADNTDRRPGPSPYRATRPPDTGLWYGLRGRPGRGAPPGPLPGNSAS